MQKRLCKSSKWIIDSHCAAVLLDEECSSNALFVCLLRRSKLNAQRFFALQLWSSQCRIAEIQKIDGCLSQTRVQNGSLSRWFLLKLAFFMYMSDKIGRTLLAVLLIYQCLAMSRWGLWDFIDIIDVAVVKHSNSGIVGLGDLVECHSLPDWVCNLSVQLPLRLRLEFLDVTHRHAQPSIHPTHAFSAIPLVRPTVFHTHFLKEIVEEGKRKRADMGYKRSHSTCSHSYSNRLSFVKSRE